MQLRTCFMCGRSVTLMDGRSVRVNERAEWFCNDCARGFFASGMGRKCAYLKARTTIWQQHDSAKLT